MIAQCFVVGVDRVRKGDKSLEREREIESAGWCYWFGVVKPMSN